MLLSILKKDYPKIALIISLGQIGNESFFKHLNKVAQNLKIEKSIYFLSKKELWPIIKRSDFFLRPTLSDSYGISIAEAISVGTPAIASDVCQRPAKTILFKTGNKEDFFLVTKKALDKLYQERPQQEDSSRSLNY